MFVVIVLLEDPLSASWQRQPGFSAKMSWFLVKIMMPLTLTGPQHQWKQNSSITTKIPHHILL
jgi:hypothetical protein